MHHIDSKYKALFEPIAIGPVTAPNRFYQVPHASGMTEANPRVRAAFRGTKAEGGWGVVSTGAVSIHPSSDDSPLPFARLWDDNDVRAHALSTAAIHEHGALAAVELWHGGGAVMNRSSRIAPYSPSGIPWAATHVGFMGQLKPRIMDKRDIRDVIAWQVAAAKRARQADFDIVYVYAGMGYLGYQFLLPETNTRHDEYGGSLANRARFTKEMLEATRDAIGEHCGIALRISLEELRARPSEHFESEAHELVSLLADVPDLWDVKMDSSPTDCGASRFRPEASHEPVIEFVRRCTTKPVVGVGRFTSPDTMLSQLKRGVLDLVGAARPSIADPFLPNKIRNGQEDQIRECIGCNICIASWHDGVPVRCTQNATAGEEWRRGWHPETVAAAGSEDSLLIVGGGPAGLEAALIAARRGYQVTLADSRTRLGGRVGFEAGLPGLASWGRVTDYRLYALQQLPNVELFPASTLSADDVLQFGATQVAIATGAKWTRHRYSTLELPVSELQGAAVFTPDDLAAGHWPEQGPVLVYDFDNYYMGGVLAEALSERGLEVSYATPAGHASAWTIMTNEQPFVHQSLSRRGIERHTLALLDDFQVGEAVLSDLFSGTQSRVEAAAVVVVGARLPKDSLYHAVLGREAEWQDAGVKAVTRIGDALAPGAIVHAVYSGHEFARQLDGDEQVLYLRDIALSEHGPGPAY